MRLAEEMEKNAFLTNKIQRYEPGFTYSPRYQSKSNYGGFGGMGNGSVNAFELYGSHVGANPESLESENRSLRMKLAKQNDEMSRLQYELEMLKANGDKLRKETIYLLSKK